MLKKKPSRRQDKRKEINFLILNGTTLDRKRPHDDKVEHFVQSIISNQISNFGIKILSEIDLEIIQDFEESKYTFLQLAVYLGRDAIVAAFIRAGSKLFTTSCICSLLLRAILIALKISLGETDISPNFWKSGKKYQNICPKA
jgi:hypothetical protein